ncbi:uncharacterized protein LOC126783494 [Argentina anserina]|uniref:uncharacterized protein LOC126783494 n=1 Tax=Argentina anserina TaxID=57926 RepID=UPI00217649FE|nr:uncharacterized protein LOC126783494 [Potentilla anserina]
MMYKFIKCQLLILWLLVFLQSNSRSHAQSCFDEHLVQRVVQIFKSNICLPSSTVPKDGRKCQENSTKSNVIKGDIGTGTGHRRKQAFFPGALGSDGNGASKKSEFSLGKEVVSSCDSVATESSLDDQNVRRSTTALMENVNVNRSIDKEHSNHPSKYKFTRESSADILTELLETDSGETLTDESLKERVRNTMI